MDRLLPESQKDFEGLEKFRAWKKTWGKTFFEPGGLIVGEQVISPASGGSNEQDEFEHWKIGFKNAIRKAVSEGSGKDPAEVSKNLQALVNEAQRSGITRSELQTLLAELKISTANPKESSQQPTNNERKSIPTTSEFKALLDRYQSLYNKLSQAVFDKTANEKQYEVYIAMRSMQFGALIDAQLLQPQDIQEDAQVFDQIKTYLDTHEPGLF